MDELSERVLKHFRIKKTEATNKLVHALRVPKKSLNNVLYKLERQSLVVKLQDSPPVWGLPEYASSPNSSSSFGRMTRKRKAKEMEQIQNTDHESTEMSTKILSYLESKKAAKPIEIAKAVGVTKPTVNPFLYALERKGLIMKNSGKALTWSLSNSHDQNFSSDTQASTSGQQFVPNSRDFPLFQDPQLFRIDVSLDMEDTELLSGETEDNDLDLNEGLNAGYEYNGPSVKQEADFESETGECSSENTFNNIKYEVEEDAEMENSCNSETECNVIASVDNGEIKSEDTVKSESCEDMVQITDSEQSEADLAIQNMGFDSNSQGMLHEAETVSVRNVSGSPSLNMYISKNDDDQICTSEIPLLNTPDLSKLKNDNQEESDQLNVENHSRLSPTNKCDIIKEAFDLEKGIVDIDDENSTQSMENDNDNKSNLKGLNCNMEHCDKILQVLSTLPGCAEFVLVNRTELDKVDIETALGRCQELGFVSGCTKLWRITPEGIDYIEDKFGTNETETSVVNVEPPVQTKKFSGPPPSPMALLKNKAGFTGGSSMALPSQQAVSNNRDRSPLNRTSFRPSSSNSQVRSTNIRHNVAINSISSSQGFMRNPLNQSLFPTDNSVQMTKKLMGIPESSDVNSGLWDKNPNEIKSPPRNLYQTKSTNPSALFNQSSFKQPKVPVQDQTMSHTNIPSKYADYPNKATSTQVLRTTSSKTSGASQDNKPVSTKPSIPPSPMEILSKNLKKTEISPPNTPPLSKTYNPLLANSQQSVHSSQSIQRQFGGNQISQTLNSSQTSLMAGQFGKQSLLSSNTSRMSGQFGNQSIKSSTPSLMSGQFRNQNMSLQVKQNQSGTVQPINTDFKSLPVSVNKISGNAKTGLNSLALSNESFNALNKNAVSALMEYAQSRKMEARVQVIGQRGPPHRPIFTMAAYVGNRQFSPVTCTNKKDGRKEACDIAMRQLVAEGQFQAETASEAAGSKPQASLETMTHFDKIAALTHRGFTALVSQITAESFAGRKVIAGLVMKRSDDDTGVLISLGTGNRCITGQQLSLQGNTVNDSHAEIITRRGFMRFLYKQLLDYDPAKTNPLFERSRTGKLQIRPKITFHLYISTAPCGDGALFSPRDAESNKTPVDSRIRPPHEPVFSSNVQGLLRTKVEGGEGTIPIEPGFKGQTFDGIQRGERLRTMSCTDKVCRWNVVGMQGALLSHFIEPVYLDSLTLGLLYDHGHLSRAVCCRVGRGPTDIDNLLPTNYRLNHPWLGRVTTCDPPREVQKTKAVSVNWSFGDSAAEVTDGTLGLCNTSIEKGMFSRCSKRNMYNSFKSVCEKFGRQDLLTAENYKDAKMMASDFQEAREAMLRKFKENKYGPWVSKPIEEEMFTWEET